MTDNLILSSIFHFLLNFQQRSQWGIDITSPLFLNSLPLPFHSSAVTPPLRILTRIFSSHCLTCDRKKCCSIITISSSLNVLWHQFKTLTPLEFPHNMQSHVLRIPEILYSIKTRLLLIKSALIYFFSSTKKSLFRNFDVLFISGCSIILLLAINASGQSVRNYKKQTKALITFSKDLIPHLLCGSLTPLPAKRLNSDKGCPFRTYIQGLATKSQGPGSFRAFSLSSLVLGKPLLKQIGCIFIA